MPLATTGRTPRQQRASITSRRSRIVGSSRSSVNSINHPPSGLGLSTYTLNSKNATVLSRQRSDASRRSLATSTPTSKREEISSRPSSVPSFSAFVSRLSSLVSRL
ncbi:hypothetical protein M407DRAFT_246851 [Tulasnella calospora MUT 4182]|uniref:Uncharacterized protein n=1 Tax=Tulasnella calospora MUT 4182 TaxID=1051891 RepID=A0A0C3K6Q8_9AGAM|nr:hypothetical protein M407DRAFT_246851 [Tulasnella calospora MUT 4182]